MEFSGFQVGPGPEGSGLSIHGKKKIFKTAMMMIDPTKKRIAAFVSVTKTPRFKCFAKFSRARALRFGRRADRRERSER